MNAFKRFFRTALPVLVLLTAAFPALAAPVISYRGIVNAASFLTAGLPNGSIARGAIFTIFGRDLGPADAAIVSSFPLQNNFQGVEIEVCQGAGCVGAIPIFVSSGQINAVMPSNAPLGRVLVRVIFNGERGAPRPVNVVESTFGIFSIASSGFGPGIIQNVVTSAERPINSTNVTARPGQIVIIWGTGLGAGLNADNAAPEQGDLPVGVEVFVGGVKASNILYRGRTGCCSGVDQIIFELPPNVPEGCYVPVVVRVDGGIVSNTVTMGIRGDGSACTDAFNVVGNAMRAGERMALFLPHRMQARVDLPVPEAQEITTDWFYGSVRDEAGGEFFFNPLFSLPPIGTCTAYGSNAEQTGLEWISRMVRGGEELDAGEMLTLMGGSEERVLDRRTVFSRVFADLVGKDTAAELFPALIFGSGNNSVGLPGGAEAGAVNAVFGALRSVTWSNRDSVNVVRRLGSLRATWSGGNPGEDVVLVAGAARVEATNAGAQFLCTAGPEAGEMTVPPEVLQALPPTPERIWGVPAEVMVINSRLRSPVRVDAAGVDAGYIVSSSGSLKTVAVE